MPHVPYAALLAAFMLIYLPRIGPVNAAMAKLPGGYNNTDPRAQQAMLDGRARRALNAHLNGFEAFAPFAAALIVALRSPHQDLVAYLAIAFVVVRTTYVIAYLADKAQLRSGMWGAGMLVITALMILAIIA
jgi:uncharacterized MAPEG superfamily protein